MKRIKVSILVSLAVVLLLAPVAAMAGETLDAVKARGYLSVGVNGGLFGFGMPDEKGVWRGLDVDTAEPSLLQSLVTRKRSNMSP